MNDKKFREPRGWALKWVLAEEEAQTQTLAAEQQKPEHGNDNKFSEPRACAVKWDGPALADNQARQMA